MIALQMLVDVPAWARERCLDERSFDILEQVALNPERKELILAKIEYETACCINQALEYARSKGLV